MGPDAFLAADVDHSLHRLPCIWRANASYRRISNYLSLSGYYRSGGLKGLGALVFLSSTVLSLPLVMIAIRGWSKTNRSVAHLFTVVILLVVCLIPAVVIGYRSAFYFRFCNYFSYTTTLTELCLFGVLLFTLF